MILVIGLGNPEKKYQNTRHNVGFMITDRLVKSKVVSPHVETKFKSMIFHHHKSKTIFARPQTSIMNQALLSVKL